MKFIWALTTPFSFAIASTVVPRNETKDFASDYNWECSNLQNSTLDLNDCMPIFAFLSSASRTGWWTIGNDPAASWFASSCRLTLKAEPASNYVLNMRGDEFASVGWWASKEKCSQPMQRTMIKPKNGTWTVYITEVGWDFDYDNW